MGKVGNISYRDDPAEMLVASRSALIIVDMQNDYCSPDGISASLGRDAGAVRAIIGPIAQLLGEARRTGVLVVYLQNTTLPGLAGTSPAWARFMTKSARSAEYTIDGTWGHQIVDELRPLEGEIIVKKNRSSGFHRTNLDLVLRANAVETVVAVGCATQGCVLATVYDASFHDYYAVVAQDCVMSASLDLHTSALACMRDRYELLTGVTIAELWSR